MKVYVWLLVFLVTPLHIAKAADLSGTWEWSDEGYTMTLILNHDGTGTLDEIDISYSVKGDRLLVNEEGEDINYKFQLADNKLTLSEGDLDEPTVFTRKGSSQRKGIGSHKANKKEDDATGIVGTWTIQAQKGTVTLDLKPDGSGSLDGSTFTWRYEQKILMLSMRAESIMYNVMLAGDQLTLSGGDLQQPATFQRKSTGKQGGAGMPSSSSASRPSSNADCNVVVLAANVTGGCRIRMVTPTLCEEIDLTGGQWYEFAWTTDGSDCETPYTLIISGNPATEMNSKSWQLSTNVEQGITRRGGITNVTANDLNGLTTDNGLYHWVVIGYYGSHPDSGAFRVRK